jgi:hypothetical protein
MLLKLLRGCLDPLQFLKNCLLEIVSKKTRWGCLEISFLKTVNQPFPLSNDISAPPLILEKTEGTRHYPVVHLSKHMP